MDEVEALMPAVFIGHGSPMNALERNHFTDAWRTFGAGVPKPRAVLCISAHWYIHATAVTAMARPRTIHDFYGFPSELHALEYPAPGDPALAAEIIETVAPTWVGRDDDSWGLDHGTWSVLTHVFPDADVPVVQLSIDAAKPLSYHLELGAALAPLRRRGILVVGSGNVVHNLGILDPSLPDGGYPWADAFDEAATGLLADRPGDIASLADRADFDLAVPTPEHLLPLFYVAGMAAAEGSSLEPLVEGMQLGSLSMASHVLR